MSLDDYQLADLVAVQWCPELAAQFPDADHAGCRVRHVINANGTWQPAEPVDCQGWHCPNCGAATNLMGHHTCTNNKGDTE